MIKKTFHVLQVLGNRAGSTPVDQVMILFAHAVGLVATLVLAWYVDPDGFF
ncbi:MAG: hypothetical protein AB1646_11585 [Thermodesulfobacteriota bacterium]